MDVIGGLDVGFRDPTAFVVLGYCWKTEKYYLFEEYYQAERTTEQHAKAIRDLVDKYDIDYIYIDSAAQQMRFDLAQDYDLTTIDAKKDVNAGIAHVATVIDNDNLIVDSKCKQVLRSVDQYQWDPNPNLMREKPLHNDASHMADALRYAIYTFQTSMVTF